MQVYYTFFSISNQSINNRGSDFLKVTIEYIDYCILNNREQKNLSNLRAEPDSSCLLEKKCRPIIFSQKCYMEQIWDKKLSTNNTPIWTE